MDITFVNGPIRFTEVASAIEFDSDDAFFLKFNIRDVHDHTPKSLQIREDVHVGSMARIGTFSLCQDHKRHTFLPRASVFDGMLQI